MTGPSASIPALPQFHWRVGNSWNTGFTAYIDIVNDTDSVMEDFSILIPDPGFEITNIWGGVAQVLDNGDILITGVSWTQGLQPGQTVSLGFNGAGPVPEAGSLSYGATLDGVETGPVAEPDPVDPPEPEPEPEPQPEDPPAEPETPGTPAPSVSFRVTSDWGHGFNAEIVVTNDTGAPIEDWTILIADPGFALRNVWGATHETDAAGDVRLEAVDWTMSLAPGETRSIGFTAEGPAPQSAPVLSILADGASVTDDPDPVDPGDGDPGDPPDTGDPDDEPGDGGSGDPAASPFDTGDYGAALNMSMQFYYAQYSGPLPEDFPLGWRGDSAKTDGADVGADLTGGWYDAGDHVKFGLPMAFSATLLAWGAADHADGYAAAGATDDILAHLEWVTDYFLRCYDDNGTADLSDDIFHAQVGDGFADHAVWGAPEDMAMHRPTYSVTADRPGTEVTAETAAALASASIVFRDAGDTAYADTLLDTAIRLFDFSAAYQGSYADAIPEVRSFYNSHSGYQDELAWAAAWLHEATGEADYLALAEAWYPGGNTGWALGWDDKSNGVAMLLAEATGEARYLSDIDAHLAHMTDSLPRTPGTATNDGLAWLDQWGSNRYAANTAFLAVERADLAERSGDTALAAELRDFAADQIDYMLGDNPDGQSYVVGFGDSFPLNPHHRAASGTTDLYDSADNLHVLTGALVGGPDVNGNYADERWDYTQNEVATDYNAGFSGALAGLIDYDLG